MESEIVKSETAKKILENLKDHKEGQTVREIAKDINVAPATCSKYVLFLNTKGLVEIRKIGRAYLVKKVVC